MITVLLPKRNFAIQPQYFGSLSYQTFTIIAYFSSKLLYLFLFLVMFYSQSIVHYRKEGDYF